jgi:hypothetical protein
MLEIKPAVRLSLNQFLSSLLSLHGRAATTTHLPCHHLPARALPPACSRHHRRCLLRSSLLRQCVICRCPCYLATPSTEVPPPATIRQGHRSSGRRPQPVRSGPPSRPLLLWLPPTAGLVGPAAHALAARSPPPVSRSPLLACSHASDRQFAHAPPTTSLLTPLWPLDPPAWAPSGLHCLPLTAFSSGRVPPPPTPPLPVTRARLPVARCLCPAAAGGPFAAPTCAPPP